MAQTICALLLMMNTVKSLGFPYCDDEYECGSPNVFACDPNTNCHITCIGYSSCPATTFTCPSGNYNCTVDASSDISSVMAGTTIHATNSATLQVNLGSNVGNHVPFSSGTINCPKDGICEINIIGAGMTGATIHAEESASLTISVIGGRNDPLANTNIYCPDNGHQGGTTCTITSTGAADGQIWEAANIYAVEGTYDSTVQCFNGNCGDAILWCTEALNVQCPITASNNWICNTGECYKWLHPTFQPTFPTRSPTGYPSPAPTFSSVAVYVTKTGTDSGFCQLASPCQTLDFGYDCIIGEECSGFGYNGEGTLSIGAGTFYFSRQHAIERIQEGGLRFTGTGYKTSKISIGSAEGQEQIDGWFGCITQECYIELSGLTLQSNRTFVSDTQLMAQGGMFRISDVLFDGNNFVSNQEGNPYYMFQEGANIIFETCIFTHLDTLFFFNDGVTAEFINCEFVNNNLTTLYYGDNEPFMYVGGGSIVTFTDCIFDHNIIGRNLFTLDNFGQIILSNTLIRNTESVGNKYVLVSVGTSKCVLQIIDGSRFEYNSDLDALISIDQQSNMTLTISDAAFRYNTNNNYDIRAVSLSFASITIQNSQFSSSQINTYALALYSVMNLAITDCTWSSYNITSQSILFTNGAVNDIYLDSILMSDVNGGGVEFQSNTQTLYVDNSTFYNVGQGNAGFGCVYAPLSLSTLIIRDSIFTKCKGRTGGAIHAYLTTEATIFSKLTFSDNYASNIAADVYLTALVIASQMLIGPMNITGSHGVNEASSMYFQYAAGTLLLQDFTFENITGAPLIYIDSGSNGIAGFHDNTFRYIQNTIIYCSSTSDLAFERNTFEYNSGPLIIDYVPILRKGTYIDFSPGNVFNANEGGVFELIVNDSHTSQSDASSILVDDATIMNYNNPTRTLFSIASSGGNTCASEGIDWSFNTNDKPTFGKLTIINNKNTQILKTLCIDVLIEHVSLENNDMNMAITPQASTPMFLFKEHTTISTDLYHFTSINNRGIIFTLMWGGTLSDHSVQNQTGIYAFSNQIDTSNNEVYVLFQNITMSESKSMYNNYGLFSFYGSDRQIYSTSTEFYGLDLYNNTGALIAVQPLSLDNNTLPSGQQCPKYATAEDTHITIRHSTFVNNAVANDLFLIGMQGVRMWIYSDVYLTNNDCGSVSCLLLIDGWYFVDTIQFVGNDISDKNLITFGHANNVGTYYNAELCINSSMTAVEMSQYISYVNIDSPPSYNEKVKFYPCTTYTPNSGNGVSYLREIGALNSEILDFSANGANILQTTVCSETDCEIRCNGSVSCFGSELYCQSGVCNINCGEQYACSNIKIYSQEPDTIVSILCDGVSACSTGDIQIKNASMFRLICGASSSCVELNVNITGDTQHMSEIYCSEYESCDSMTITTTNRNTTVFMYQYSSEVTIHTPTGYISDPDTGEQNLYCGDPLDYLFWNEYDSVETALQTHYASTEQKLPCDTGNIEFYCTNYTESSNDTASCAMGYESVSDNYGLFECYPLFIDNLVTTFCDGTCPNSPTSNPTSTPSFAPTISTDDPSNAPSNAPTVVPSNAPSNAPTNRPSIAPTLLPSNAPSNAPTLNPSLSPSNSPIPPPTASPTIAPSIAPTLAPSFSPSIAPSLTPTLGPTSAPSRVPTSKNEYDSFIPITFLLRQLTNTIKSVISDYSNSNAIANLQQIIERGYFDAQFLNYYEFAVYIDKINGVNINEIEQNSWLDHQWSNSELEFESHIDCDQALCFFITTYDMSDETTENERRLLTNENCDIIPDFQPSVQCNLREYFESNELEFAVKEPNTIDESLVTSYTAKEEGFDYLLLGIFSFLGLMALISAFAFLYNHRLCCSLPGFSPVDNAKWMALLIFGVQAWDFISDINLAIEIWGDMNGNGIPDSEEDINIGFADADLFIIISGIGATVFVVLPYIANLIVAANIKNLIRKNDAAKAYFQFYAAVFVAFVVLSGGAYPALAVVSSEIFGLQIFNSGLTAFELKSLSKIKVFGTIILENLPQIGCQILYSWTIGNITETTQLAFTASLLSVTASTLSYYIEKNAADTTAISYYLSFECKNRGKQQIETESNNGDLSPYDDVEESEAEAIKPTKTFDMNGGEINENKNNNLEIGDANVKLGISEKEKLNFWKYKGLKLKLSTAISEVFGISEKNLEIGYVQITKYGIVLHIIQYVYSTDLEELESELQSETKMNISIGCQYYIKECLFGSFQKEINEVFTNHFQTQSNDFRVCYHKRYPSNKSVNKTETHSMVNSNENFDGMNERGLEKKRSSVVHNMAKHLKKMHSLNVLPNVSEANNEIEMIAMNDRNKESEMKKKLNNVLRTYKFSSNKEQKQFLLQWIDTSTDMNIIHENEERKEEEKNEYYYETEKGNDFVNRVDSTQL